MGCGPSKQKRKGAVDLRDLAPKPTGRPSNCPAPLDLTSGDLQQSLRAVAACLDQRRRGIRLVVVGGAVSTMLLQSRQSTHDIDYLGGTTSQADLRVLQDAAVHVRQTQQQPTLEEGWLNNNTMLFIDKRIRNELTQQGFAQNEIVFQAAGLTLYAAPWPYAICAKLHRISGGGHRAYDPLDAVAYLHRYLSRRDGPAIASVTLDQVTQWCQRYHISISRPVLVDTLRRVNEEYRRLYGADAVQV
jgi:hypothetical protein